MARQRGIYAKPERIAQALETEIRAGSIRPGERLESENALVRRFRVSRTTVRKGLEVLAAKGLIETRTGIGSFVTFDGHTIDNALGWTRALAGRDRPIRTEILRIARVEDEALATTLDLADPSFIAIDRVRRLADSGVAVSLESSRVPCRPGLADLPERGLVDGSLEATLRAADLRVAAGEEWVDVVLLSASEAALMGTATGAAAMRTRRLTRGRDGSVIEHVVSLLDPRHFALHMRF